MLFIRFRMVFTTVAYTSRSPHIGGILFIEGTLNGDLFWRHFFFFMRKRPFLHVKRFCCGGKFFSAQLVAWNLGILNSSVVKHWRIKLNFRCRNVCSALANNIILSACKVRAMSLHEGACSISRQSPHFDPQCVTFGTHRSEFNVRFFIFCRYTSSNSNSMFYYKLELTTILLRVSNNVIACYTVDHNESNFSFVGAAFSGAS